MSEPITLYNGGNVVTITAPSYARELQAQGWLLTPDDSDDVPFDFAEVEPETVQGVDVVPVKAKRGRPRKVAQ